MATVRGVETVNPSVLATCVSVISVNSWWNLRSTASLISVNTVMTASTLSNVHVRSRPFSYNAHDKVEDMQQDAEGYGRQQETQSE